MAYAQEIILVCTDSNNNDVTTTIGNINPAISDSTARQAAIRWNSLTNNTLIGVLRRQTIDITSVEVNPS